MSAARAGWRGAEPPPATVSASTRVIGGDVLEVLPTLPAGFAQAAITSPPYWGLRDYGVRPRVWGGESGCRHRWGGAERDRHQGAAGLRGGCFCRRCEAWKGCLGLEPDPDLYVEHLVEVMRKVRRCLRPDGTLWLVLGDSFTNPGHHKGNPGAFGNIGRPRAAAGERAGAYLKASAEDLAAAGLKNKDLVGIPWRVAFALQADGWWLRSDTIWQKPNAMPESVRDRPTRAHEYVFLLSPSRRYFYDSFAVREPDRGGRSGNGFARPERLSYRDASGARGQADQWVGGGGRNRRSVWSIPTQCFKGAHFATFPEALVEVCLLAGTSPVACRRCGAPWRRVVSSRRLLDGRDQLSGSWTQTSQRGRSGRSPLPTGKGHWRVRVERETVGWEPSCEHDEPGGRCAVLDPFAGAATTGLVAARHGRDFVGVELSATYARMARQRLREAGTTEVGA